MANEDQEEQLLRSVALQNASSILAARQAAERELHAAQDALRESNDRIQRVLESITDGFIVLDSDWRFTYVNSRAEEILKPLQKTRAGLLGKSHWDEFPDTAGTPLEERFREAMTRQTGMVFENYYPPLKIWFELRLYPSPSGLTIYFQDITRRKQAEAFLLAEKKVLALIARGESLQTVLDAVTRETEAMSTDGMICSVLLVDDEGERLLHGSAPSLPNSYNEGIHGVRIGPSVGSCGTAAYRRERVEVSDISNDPLWAEFKGLAAASGLAACCSTPIMSSDEQVLGTIAMYYQQPGGPTQHDSQLIELAGHLAGIAIERKTSEDARKRSEMRLRATFDQAAVGIAIAGLDGRFQEFNAKFAAILGYPPGELRGQTFEDITYEDDLPQTQTNVKQLLSGQIPDFTYEKRYRRKDGSLVWCLCTVTLLKSFNDQEEQFIGVIEDISTRKAADEERLQLTSVMEKSLNEIYVFDISTLRFQYVNRGALRNLGYSLDDMRQMTPLDIKPEFNAERFQDLVAPLRSGEREKIEFQTVHRRLNGSDYPVEVHLQQVKSGKSIVFLAVILDITERLKAESTLRRSEEELRALANSIPQLAWMAHPDGHIFWYNRRWYDYTGTTPEQMQGWGWQSVQDPAILPAVTERWQHSLRTGEPFDMEFPLRGADGVFRWFLTRVNPLRDDDGKILRWFGTNTDVDEVRRITETLREETQTLELLNRAGTTIGSTLELQDLLQSVTDAATELSGAEFGAFFYNTVDARGDAYQLYTLSGASREAFEKFGHPRATPIFAPTFKGEGPIRLEDVTADPRYGQMEPHRGMPSGHLPVRSYLAVPVISRTSEVIGALFFGHSLAGVFNERAERLVVGVAAQAAVAIDNARLYEGLKKAAEEREQLLEAERSARAEAERVSIMKDEFLATLSHELRTPLNAILGWAQILGTSRTEEDLNQGVDAIQRNARAQTQLIEDLLDMSRIISGKVRLDVQWTDLASVVDAAVDSVRPSADAKGIRLRRIIDPHAGPVSGDPTRLQQIVWNLLSNAIKFTPKGGKVDVLLERVNSHLEITVRDSGVGINPEFLPYVFERFRQADSSTTRAFGGLGLGLSIVKQLAELHGGTVRAKSTGENQGATFSVSLPLAPLRSIESREHPTSLKAPAIDCEVDLEGINVLLVDDEPDARALITRVLTQCRATVQAAASADEGLALLRKYEPDLIISDIGMPGKDGYQFIQAVRGAEETIHDIPAIALTAFARSEDRTKAMLAGYQVHISKPIEPQELLATVASLAKRRPKRNERR